MLSSGSRHEPKNFELAIHEAGHAVVAHLVGIAIDHVAIKPQHGSGYSRPVRNPVADAADKLWAEANAISRKLVLADYSKDNKPIYVMRKGYRRSAAHGFPRWVRGKVRGTRAPQELVDRMDYLRKRAHALWKKANAAETHNFKNSNPPRKRENGDHGKVAALKTYRG